MKDTVLSYTDVQILKSAFVKCPWSMGHPVFLKNGMLDACCLKTSAQILPFAQGTAVSHQGLSLDTKINAVAYYF